MFNLIITIIAIGLTVALGSASLYYGGNAFSAASSSAIAATYINQVQQMQAATSLFQVTYGTIPESVDALISENYLRTIPELAVSAEGDRTWEMSVANFSDGFDPDGIPNNGDEFHALFAHQEIGDTNSEGLTLGVSRYQQSWNW